MALALVSTEPQPRRAAVYCRISDDADDDRQGVERQRADCEAFCERQGWDIVATYIDNDISASSYSKKVRKAYKAMLRAVETGEIDTVVSWHLDRLYRRPRELEDLIDLVEQERGRVLISTLYGSLDLSNSDDRAMGRVQVAMAAKSSDDSSRRIKRKKDDLADNGKPAGGGRAFGYQADGMTLEPTEAKLLREAAVAYLAGESLTGIARKWNEAGVTTPQRGSQWSATVVKATLGNPRHAALRVHRGEVVGPAAWPAILDRATHERLVAKLNKGKGQWAPRRRSVLTGLIVCGRCGAPMRRDVNNGKRVFRCRRGEGVDGCGRCSIAADPLEAFVVDAVLDALNGPSLARRRAAKGRKAKKSEAADLEDAVEADEARLLELADMFAAGDIGRPEWVRARKGIEERLSANKRALAKANGTEVLVPLTTGPGSLRAKFDALGTDRKRAVLGAVVDRVVVQPANGTRQPVEDRLRLDWRA